MNQFYTNEAVLRELGGRLQKERLNQNLSQDALANEAGVSRKTVTNLENGAGGTLGTFVAVLRALGQLSSLDAFLPQPEISPMQLLELRGKERQRATGNRKIKEAAVAEDHTEWKWGDEE